MRRLAVGILLTSFGLHADLPDTEPSAPIVCQSHLTLTAPAADVRAPVVALLEYITRTGGVAAEALGQAADWQQFIEIVFTTTAYSLPPKSIPKFRVPITVWNATRGYYRRSGASRRDLSRMDPDLNAALGAPARVTADLSSPRERYVRRMLNNLIVYARLAKISDGGSTIGMEFKLHLDHPPRRFIVGFYGNFGHLYLARVISCLNPLDRPEVSAEVIKFLVRNFEDLITSHHETLDRLDHAGAGKDFARIIETPGPATQRLRLAITRYAESGEALRQQVPAAPVILSRGTATTEAFLADPERLIHRSPVDFATIPPIKVENELREVLTHLNLIQTEVVDLATEGPTYTYWLARAQHRPLDWVRDFVADVTAAGQRTRAHVETLDDVAATLGKLREYVRRAAATVEQLDRGDVEVLSPSQFRAHRNSLELLPKLDRLLRDALAAVELRGEREHAVSRVLQDLELKIAAHLGGQIDTEPSPEADSELVRTLETLANAATTTKP